MSANGQPRRILTGPMIGALVALFALAVATVIVVVTSDDDEVTTATGTTGNEVVADPSGDPDPIDDPDPSDGPQPSEGPDPSDPSLTPSLDGTFSFQMPDGWADATGVVKEIAGTALRLYDVDSATASMPTHILVAAAPDDGTSIAAANSMIRAQFETDYGTTTEASSIQISEIDGEPTQGWQSGDYFDGVDVTSTQFAVVHDGTFYFFTVNSLPEYVDEARAGLEAVMKTTVWT